MSRKLIGAFLVVSLLVAVTSGLTYFMMRGVQSSYDRLLQHQSAVLTNISEIQAMTERQKGQLYGYLLKPGDAAEQELRKTNGQLAAQIDALGGETSKDDPGVGQMKDSSQTFARLVEKAVGYVREKKPDLARTEAEMWAVPTSDALTKSAVKVRNDETAKMAKAKADNQANVRFILQSLIGLSVLAVVLAVLIGWVLSRMIVRPMKRLVESAGAIADGDLTGEDIVVRSRDELRKLADAFNSMKGGLRDILRQTGRSAGQVTAVSGQLRSRSASVGEWSESITEVVREIAAGAETQRDSVQRGVTDMERMAASAHQIEEAFQVVLGRSSVAREATEEGKTFMERMIDQMGSIRDGMDGLAGAVQRLTDRAAEIDRIAQAIAAIARQTNMLALNASIEASRAGAFGKSFAVVAAEIRKLSGQTATAAEEVGTVVDNIRLEMEQVDKSASTGSREVAAGLDLVRRADDSFASIDESVREVFRQIEEMTGRTVEMTRLSMAAAEAMEGIRQVSEHTAAGTLGVKETVVKQHEALEEMAESAELLTREAHELQQRISRFQVG